MESEISKICSEAERLKFFDCDYKNRIKISTILKIGAELAGLDYHQKGFSHEDLWNNQMVFLLSRISVKILKYPTDKQIITSSTWECGKKGAMFLRGTEICDENGDMMVSISSGWILTNPITRHIYKPSAFLPNIPQVMDREDYALPIGKIQVKNLKKIGDRAIRATDMDANGHAYNAVYADIACDFLSKDFFEKDVENFRINFVSEAILGDNIEIFEETTADKTVIIGILNEKTCFETEFIFKK